MATADKIMLGTGVFTVGTVALGLTRGGGTFTVEREFRDIEADGDRGSVEGRVVIDSEIPKLMVNGLDMFTPAELVKYYAGTGITTTTTSNTFTGTLVVATTDYYDIKWAGKTKDGKAVTITVTKALNREGLEWNLEDKNEVVPQLTFTGHYTEAARNTPPWNVVFAV